jgi:hypothetical protein
VTARPRPSAATLLALTTLAVLAGGCRNDAAAPSQGPTAPATGSPAPAAGSPAAGSPSPAAVAAEILDPLIADASTRTGAGPAQITVIEAEATTWTTGALGCPAPGVGYTQQLVRGWRVLLDANGTRLDYRVSAPGRFKLCEGAAG